LEHRSAGGFAVDAKLLAADLWISSGDLTDRTVVLDDPVAAVLEPLDVRDVAAVVELLGDRPNAVVELESGDVGLDCRDELRCLVGKQSVYRLAAIRFLDLIEEVAGECRRRVGKEPIAFGRELVDIPRPAALAALGPVADEAVLLELLEMAANG